MTTDTLELPELPEPNAPAFGWKSTEGWLGGHPVSLPSNAYTADQMRAYALQYGELVREECARKVESFSDPEDDGWESAIREFASAIRNKE